jgi:hypothetical protein
LLGSASRKRGREAATDFKLHSTPKHVRGSRGADALQSMSESLVGFGTAITAALAPSVPILPPSPIRRMTAVTAVLHLEADWLTLAQRVALIDFLRTDCTAADIYLALTETDIRKEWVRVQLKRLNVVFA